ncbi:hypothetical protein CWR48_04260 [Oceanobacillus arenosus]|uniref:Uncharacterized protein n=1 Tax=Oceanobacillus arenosus TaxID=1229153 RepID=A0A3D8PZ06_9BACI|nr:hypothetical protein [Oceanobacillus arenosus]RDW21032.1 hypothetical protein CWR48_04260 [Oceanobacillus arenosus]
MSEHNIVLSEHDIARLINGEEVSTKINGEKVTIRQSYMKDAAADILVRKMRVMNTVSNTFEY